MSSRPAMSRKLLFPKYGNANLAGCKPVPGSPSRGLVGGRFQDEAHVVGSLLPYPHRTCLPCLSLGQNSLVLWGRAVASANSRECHPSQSYPMCLYRMLPADRKAASGIKENNFRNSCALRSLCFRAGLSPEYR